MATYIELTETVPEHIQMSESNTAICGTDCTGDDARVVPDDRDPVGDASVHICPDCADDWDRIAGDVERGDTVQCRAVRLIDGDARHFVCGDTVPATVARAMRNGDVRVPVCPDCYEYLYEYDSDVVVTPIEDSPAWTNVRCPPE